MLKYFYLSAVLIAFGVLLEHCSFNETVVADCARIHPSSMQGQLLCQKRLDAKNNRIATEKAAKNCVDGDEKRLREVVSSIRAETIASAGKNLDELHANLSRKYPKENFSYKKNSKDANRMVIVAKLNTICKSSYSILINIRPTDVSNKVAKFAAWENSPLNDDIEEHDLFLSEYAWSAK